MPYADLVLISTNSITAILFNTFLSVKYLDEKFIWKYDVPAYSLMAIGAIVIVLQASASQEKFTPEEIRTMLLSFSSMLSTSIGFAFLLATLIYMRLFLQQIKKFEVDIDEWALQQTKMQTPRLKQRGQGKLAINKRTESIDSADSDVLLDSSSADSGMPHNSEVQVAPQIPRVLIKILTIFPEELIKELSARSNLIRKTARVPMCCLLVCTGLLGGYSTTYFKFFAELIVEGATL